MSSATRRSSSSPSRCPAERPRRRGSPAARAFWADSSWAWVPCTFALSALRADSICWSLACRVLICEAISARCWRTCCCCRFLSLMLFRSALAGSAVDPRPSATTSATAPRMYRRLLLMGKARVGAPPYAFARDLAKIGHSPATNHQGSGTSLVTQASRSHAVRREACLRTEHDRRLAQILLPQQ